MRARMLALAALWAGAAAGCRGGTPAHERNKAPHVVARSTVEAGRYLVLAGGCNDCHTDDYLRTQGEVPERKWLLGSSVGWRGPWGTTYGTNLRLRVQEMTEDTWVAMLRTRKERPPMLWKDVNQMSDADLRAMYAYLRALGPAGEHAPPAVGPGVEPATPYIVLTPVSPAARL